MTEFNTIESLAKRLCESRHGAGSWGARNRKRAAYRAAAQRLIDKGRGVTTADALMKIFGYRRLWK